MEISFTSVAQSKRDHYLVRREREVESSDIAFFRAPLKPTRNFRDCALGVIDRDSQHHRLVFFAEQPNSILSDMEEAGMSLLRVIQRQKNIGSVNVVLNAERVGVVSEIWERNAGIVSTRVSFEGSPLEVVVWQPEDVVLNGIEKARSSQNIISLTCG
ncbi:MAG: hypothetical protein PHS57_04710 [Alphaproteobacteria bacterium]|nr:hypothetical protein [Alphaproteobacteria bacterium]